MRIIIVLILLSICSISYSAIMDVNTGIGYIKDSEGKIVCKYDLPKGQHPLKDGYTYTEVSNKKELEKIEVYQEPVKTLTVEEKLKKIGLTKQELKELVK